MTGTQASDTTMRAWAINAYGEPMRMMDLPLPKPGPNDVLIRMHGAEVGEWDERVRTGKWQMGRPFPVVLGLTAHETLLDILQVRKDEVVLITAAAGGVGHLAVQIAKHLGAKVIATASHRHAEFVAALGADTVIDSAAVPSLKDAIHNEYRKGVDKVLNNVADDAANQLLWVMRDGGALRVEVDDMAPSTARPRRSTRN